MWSRGLLSIVLLSLISGGISQKLSILPVEFPDFPSQTCYIPKPSESLPQPKCDYTMIVPYKLTSGSAATMCLWTKSEVAVNVTVSMEYAMEKNVIITVDVSENSEIYKCTSFSVPKVQKQERYFFTYLAIGDGVYKADRKSVVIDGPRVSCLAQRNKPQYKKGETVHLRFVCFDEDLKQVVKLFKKVIIKDPHGTHINEILNPPLDNGVLTLSFTTSEFSQVGYYSIQTEDEKGKVDYTSFLIQTYELPRIKFNAQCPKNIAVLDKYAEISGTAEYQFGKPVQGNVSIKCCRNVPKYGSEVNCFRGVPNICHESIKELDKKGNFYEAVDMGMFKLPFSTYDNSISCDITMKEDGTGALNPTSCYIPITNRLAVLTIDRTKMGRFYNKISVLFSARLTDEKGNPLAQRIITVAIDNYNVKCLTTDENGQVECELDTSSYFKENITVQATYQDKNLCYGRPYYYDPYDNGYPSDYVNLYRYYTHSGSLVRLRPLSGTLACYQNYSLRVDYLFTEHGVGQGATTASIKYFMTSRGNIVAHGERTVDLSKSYSGSTTIDFYIDASFATGAEVLVFVPLAKDVISDTVTLEISECFKNNVNLEFTEEEVEPGATVYRKITGAPGSFCGLRARDDSFNSINYYDEFNPYNVYSRVQSYFYGYEYSWLTYKEPEPPCIDANTVYFCQGLYMKPASFRTYGETLQNFQNLHVLLYTNLGTRKPKVCGELFQPDYPIVYKEYEMSLIGKTAFNGPMAPNIYTYRADFRDYFGFVVTILDSEGVSVVPSDIPDKLTTWVSDAFCVSPEEGIGLTIKPAFIKTFQVFFVETSVPSYITRGEVVNVPIQVSNYMDNCAMVTVKVQESENYIVDFLDNPSEQCICGQESTTLNVKITFLKKGSVNLTIQASTVKISNTCDGPHDDNELLRSDTIVKSAKVKLEGLKREATFSLMASVSDSSDEVSVSVVEPDNMVADSFELFVNVGDPVALPLKNFDNLLSTPTFSCYQIQSYIQSIITLENYLKALGRLDEEQSKKFVSRLALAYMDLLSCSYYTGTFNLYLNSNSRNTWVTLPCLYTVHRLKAFIFIDNTIMSRGLSYLSQKQDLQSGCMMPDGLPIKYQENYDMIMQFNAFAVPILVELSAHYSNAGPLLKGVSQCISTANFSSYDTLTQAYLLDAAASLEKFEQWQQYYNILAKKAITTGGFLYWRSKNSVPLLINHYFPRVNQGDVSITATILISMTKQPNPTQTLKDSMGMISKWLSSQLNRRGACYASQDTNLLIEALTRFGLSIHHGDTDAQVSVLHNGVEVFSVHVTEENKFVVHSEQLNSGFGEYSIVVNGKGNTLVQITTFYNMQISTGDDSAFAVSAVATPYECIGGVGKQISVELSFRYKGHRNQSSNCVVRCEILTGYVVEFSNAPQEVSPPRMEENTALFFLNSVTSKETKFTVSLYLRTPVSNFQPAIVVIADTETGESGVAKYYYPC